MKIRTGFVSNSSSSSFIIFYDEVEFEKILPHDGVWANGHGLSDVDDFFEVDDEVLKLLEKHVELRKCFDYYKVYCAMNTDEQERLMRKDLTARLPLSCKVKAIEKSYHSCQDAHDIRERYL